jgi:hypothetical protein
MSDDEDESDHDTEENEDSESFHNKEQPTKADEHKEDNDMEIVTEIEDESSHHSNSEMIPQVKWLLYPDDEEDSLDFIDHKLESLLVKGRFQLFIVLI